MSGKQEYREIAVMACQQEADLSAAGSGRRMVFQRAAQMLKDDEAENRKLARWLKGAWDQPECPECGRFVAFNSGDAHADDCEFAAWLGSRDRKEDGDA